MKEENVREWGVIHPLDDLAFPTDGQLTAESSPTPENLIYQFTSRFAFRKPEYATSLTTSFAPAYKKRETENVFDETESQALTLNYGHPRFIEYPEVHEDFDISHPRSFRLILPLLLTATSVFVVWYIYHLTGQQLKLISENNRYLESLSHWRQAAADLVSPRIKVITIRDLERTETTAKLFWNTSSQSCQIYLSDLPEIRQGQVFQLWFFTRDSQFIPVTSFMATRGSAAVKCQIPSAAEIAIDRIVISMEQPGNKAFPLGKIILSGQLQ